MWGAGIFIYMEMEDIVKKLIEKVIIPKYGELNYKLSGVKLVIVMYTDLPDGEINNIIKDTKMLLTMLGLKNIEVNRNVDGRYTFIEGDK